MKLMKWISACALVLSTASYGWTAYPERPVRMIIGYPAGQATDIVGRLIAEQLAEKLGQPFIVENRPGQGASLALSQLTKEKADGYAMVLSATAAYVTNPHLYKSIDYDTLNDFEPIGTLIDFPLVMVANIDTPYDTYEEFLEYARENPGSINHSSSGNGTLSHLGMALLQKETDINLLHVPYNGSVQAMTDVAAGNVDVGIDTVTVTKSLIDSGRLKPLAVTVPKRLNLYPDTPTLDELGVDGFNVAAWLGMVFPAGTPTEYVKIINDQLKVILADPSTVKQLEALGASPRFSTAEEFANLLQHEYVTWGTIVKESGARVD